MANSKDDGRKIRIPVIFHIIYSSSTENISDANIIRELSDLNADFNASNDMSLLLGDFTGIVGNANIEFYLYDSIWGESKTKGVNRLASTPNLNKNTYLHKAQTCLNIFVANHGNSTPYPADKVNLHYTDIGVNSHALTHETGHWLGLYHIWGTAGSNYPHALIFSSHDDKVDDTPAQWRATATCYEITENCPCPPKRTTYKGHTTLYNNFMDYNPCRCMFTKKQVIRMRNYIIENKVVEF